MELSRYLAIAWRRKLMIVLTAALIIAITAVATWRATPKYSASAIVRVSTAADGSSEYINHDLAYSDRLMKTYVRLATLRPALDQLKQRLGAAELPELEVYTQPNTELIQITATSTDATLAAAAANSLAEILIAQASQTVMPGDTTAPHRAITIVDPALAPAAPSSPRVRLNLLLGTLFGLASGLALALAAELVAQRRALQARARYRTAPARPAKLLDVLTVLRVRRAARTASFARQQAIITPIDTSVGAEQPAQLAAPARAPNRATADLSRVCVDCGFCSIKGARFCGRCGSTLPEPSARLRAAELPDQPPGARPAYAFAGKPAAQAGQLRPWLAQASAALRLAVARWGLLGASITFVAVALVLLGRILAQPLPNAAASDAAPIVIIPATSAPVPAHASTAPPAATALPAAVARTLDPAEALVTSMALTVTVRGERLDQVRDAALVSADGTLMPAALQAHTADRITLLIAPPARPLNGAIAYTLQLDGQRQPGVAIRLRDFIERRTVQGVRADYAYTSRVASDARGPYTTLRAEPRVQAQPVGQLRVGDQVELLQDDVAGWYNVRIRTSADQALVGTAAWVERWLIDNQQVPLPGRQVYAGTYSEQAFDQNARCGAAFESTIWGSVEDRAGNGIGGAVVQVTSSDRQTSYRASTKADGSYSVPGLGCTTWVVRLVGLPNGQEFQANGVYIRTLNGGRASSVAVRFRQQP